jgi:hypothetical protein
MARGPAAKGHRHGQRGVTVCQPYRATRRNAYDRLSGPDDEGKLYTVIFSGLPVAGVYFR